VVLVVLNGLGIGAGAHGAATARAVTPFFDRAYQLYPHAELEASGPAVGLPAGESGNSEIGAETLGAGRVLEPERIRIQKALDNGELERNRVFQRLVSTAAGGSGRLHLLGLISDGGVHSSLRHLEAILAAIVHRGLTPILHAFTDGHDVRPRSAQTWIPSLEERLHRVGGVIATVSGRYYAMDRDQRWDRIAQAYRAIALGSGVGVGTAAEAIEQAYNRDESDEFIQPSVIAGTRPIQEGESALCFNFRADRARQLTHALSRAHPDRLGRELKDLPRVELSALATWTVYDEAFALPALFDRAEITGSIGELVSRAGLRQLRIAETENRATATAFLNGGREQPFSGEDRILVPSREDVPTYDLAPEMSAIELTDRLLDALDGADYPFVVVSYANAEMVARTGVINAFVRAVEVLDACLDRVTSSVLGRGGTLLITADRGNLDPLLAPSSGDPQTARATGTVPVLWVIDPAEGRGIRNGGLADVAPSLCRLLDVEVPEEMTGRCLLTGDLPFSNS
jgi:2,3-bisphosphoglycerate-independent phosphoglycerate mutase